MSDILERYAAAERTGRSRVPNRAIEAFGLEWWNVAGYPYRIESLDELWRYHDSMHEGRYKANLDLIGKITSADADLCATAADVIYKFSASRFPFATPARDALTRALYQFLLLRDRLRTTSPPWTILEIGPGSGYLGLLLGLSGQQYRAVEAAQAFFTYQSELWRFAFGDGYSDGLSGRESAQVSHVPWWTFNEVGFALPTLDAATCNHALAEMHPGAVRRIFTITRRARRNDCFVLAESLGKRHHSTAEVIKTALDCGFDVFGDAPDLWTFRQSRTATPTVSRAAASGPSRFYAVRVMLRSRTGRRLVRIVGRVLARRRHGKSGVTPSAAPAGRLAAVFDRFPETATPDLRYQRGDW